MADKNFQIDFSDNGDMIIDEFQKALSAGLEEIGLRCEAYAAALTPVGTTESTGVQHYSGGTLRQSITHKVVDDEVYVGSNLHYAA